LDDRAGYIKRWFPEDFEAYVRLPSLNEQRDVFRYLTILRHGGVFADALSESEAPPELEHVLTARDTLVVGWDREYANAESAINDW